MSKDKGITIEGKTLEEAILKAEKALGVSREELAIEVLREARKGFFGLKEYNAIIYVKLREKETEVVPAEEVTEKDEIVYLDGSVQINDGKVKVIDPAEGGLAATISAGENMHIIVNGKLIEEPTEVYEKDEIALVAAQVEPSWQAELRVTEDKLQAFLTIHRTKGQVFFVPDMPPKREALINVQLKETIEPEIKVQDVKDFILEQGIVYGLLEEKIMIAIENPEREQLIAEGTPVTPGKNASIKILFENDELLSEEEDELKIMERVARHGVISVEPGQLLAEVIPPIEGIEGKNVYGQAIKPKPVKNISLIGGAGAEVDEGGQRVFASISGRPEIINTRVLVHPTYIITGDVDAKVGKVIFKGDVQVLGNVLDEMSIEATGKVIVNGYTANASIFAGGDIVIRKNVIGGTIRAGGISAICGKAMGILQEIKTELPQLLAGANQLLGHPSFANNKDLARIGHGVIFRMLLGNKFQDLPAKLASIQGDLDELEGCLDYPDFDQFLVEYKEIQRVLSSSGVLSLKTVTQAEELFSKFIKHVEQLLFYFEDISASKANLIVSTVQNAHLECSGEIKIVGQGAYNCNIYAGGDVFIQGMPGTFRGGEIVTEGNIVINELGSPAEIRSHIKINPGKSVKARKIYPRVIIEAGSRVERISLDQTDFVLTGE